MADYSDDFDFAAGRVTVDLDAETRDDGSAEDGPAGARDTLAEVEDVIGTLNADTLTGSAGDNALRGESGADSITGGPGADDLQGGFGNDTIDARDGVGDRVGCDDGTDAVVGEPLDNVAPDCESVDRGTAAAALLLAAADTSGLKVTLSAKRQHLHAVLARGLALRTSCSEACSLALEIALPRGRTIARTTRPAGRVRVRLGKAAARRLAAARPRAVVVRARGIDAAGNIGNARLRVVIGR